MTKRFCACTGLIGAVLVLAAVLMIVHSDVQQQRASADRARLVVAVGELDGCLTCHAAPAQEQIVYFPALQDAPPINLTFAENETYDARLAATLELGAELRAVGRRLVDLPRAQAQQAPDVVAAYLTVYDAVQTGAAAFSAPELLAALSDVEAALRLLEHQAHGERVAAPSAPDAQPDLTLAVFTTSSPPPLAAWTAQALVDAAPVVAARLVAESEIRMTPALAYALLRRGPPAAYGVDSTNFVAGRRLPVAM